MNLKKCAKLYYGLMIFVLFQSMQASSFETINPLCKSVPARIEFLENHAQAVSRVCFDMNGKLENCEIRLIDMHAEIAKLELKILEAEKISLMNIACVDSLSKRIADLQIPGALAHRIDRISISRPSNTRLICRQDNLLTERVEGKKTCFQSIVSCFTLK